MLQYLEGLHPLIQAFLATCMTWFLTALGAATVFAARDLRQKVLDGLLGFAAGVMISASYFSLLAPAIEMAQDKAIPSWFPASAGFLMGVGCLWLVDKVLPHLHVGSPRGESEGISTTWRRTTLLVLAITLHNIPEGLAVGVAFGSAAVAAVEGGSLGAALALAIGIGIQNLPEGIAVSMPLRREGVSRLKSFWYGQLSGMVEPVAGLVGAGAVLLFRPVLPYAYGFAAGAMIFVVVEEVIPESQRQGDTDLPTLGAAGGFTIMMILDVALG